MIIQSGAIIWGRWLIEGRLLFEEIQKCQLCTYPLRNSTLVNKSFVNNKIITKTQLHPKQICLPNILRKVITNKNKPWKTDMPIHFIFFELVHPYLILYLPCYLYPLSMLLRSFWWQILLLEFLAMLTGTFILKSKQKENGHTFTQTSKFNVCSA